MDWMKMLQDLLNEDPTLKDDLQEVFFNFLYKHRVNQFVEMFKELGQHLPFELILKLNNISDFPIDEIESNFRVQGFNTWYEKTHVKTVEGVTT